MRPCGRCANLARVALSSAALLEATLELSGLSGTPGTTATRANLLHEICRALCNNCEARRRFALHGRLVRTFLSPHHQETKDV